MEEEDEQEEEEEGEESISMFISTPQPRNGHRTAGEQPMVMSSCF